MNRLSLILPLFLSLEGCASLAAQTQGRDIGAYNRGRSVYQAKCASCHDVYAKRLAMPGGPTPLDEIARLYTDLDLDREIEKISQFGHYAMPAVPVTQIERQDLVVYLSSFH